MPKTMDMEQLFAQALTLLEGLHYAEKNADLIDQLSLFIKLCQAVPKLAAAYNLSRNLSMMVAFLEKRILFKEEGARQAYLHSFAELLSLLPPKKPESHSILARVDACKMTFFDHLEMLNDPELLAIYHSNPAVQALAPSPT